MSRRLSRPAPTGSSSIRSASATANQPMLRSQKLFESPVSGSAQKALRLAS